MARVGERMLRDGKEPARIAKTRSKNFGFPSGRQNYGGWIMDFQGARGFLVPTGRAASLK